MKILGLGHAVGDARKLADVDHPNEVQLEAIRNAGYNDFFVSPGTARAMAGRAAVKALEDAGYHAEDVGFIVAGQSNVPDFICIDLACQVGAELGGLEVRTVNLIESCAAAISAWFSASALVGGLQPGQVGVVVLAQRVSEKHHDRFGMMNTVLSDGAAAAVVGRLDAPPTRRSFVYRTGRDFSATRFVDLNRIERGGGMNPVVLPDHDAHHDPTGGARNSELADVLRLGTENAVRMIEASKRDAGWTDHDFVLLHTLEGRQSIAELAARLGIAPERTNADLVGRLGHMGCVAPLISLDILSQQGRIPPGTRVAMSAVSTGMKWGCCLFDPENP
jgi:3-oxoacyl-[acyl-carrier-protein] synthase-3